MAIQTRYMIRARRNGVLHFLRVKHDYETGKVTSFDAWTTEQSEATWFKPSEKKFIKELHELLLEIRDGITPATPNMYPYMKLFVDSINNKEIEYDRGVKIGILIAKVEFKSVIL